MQVNKTNSPIVGLREFREKTNTYINQVNKGKSFIIVKRSKPIFKISPPEEAWETIIDFTKIKKGGVPIEEVLKRL